MSGIRVLRADAVPHAVRLLEDRPELRDVVDLTDVLDQVGRWSA